MPGPEPRVLLLGQFVSTELVLTLQPAKVVIQSAGDPSNIAKLTWPEAAKILNNPIGGHTATYA